MLIRTVTFVCGLAVIYVAVMIKNDKTGKYASSLKDKYTNDSVDRYMSNSFNSELFFGAGLIVQSIFGSGFGYFAGLLISLLGIILLFIYMKDLKKRNVPYRNDAKR